MRLKEWIKSNNYDYRSFAKKLNTSHRNVAMWARGERMPRSDMAEKIFMITGDEVSGHDLYEEQIQRNKMYP